MIEDYLQSVSTYVTIRIGENYYPILTYGVGLNQIDLLDNSAITIFENSQFEAFLKSTIEPQLASLADSDIFEYGQKNSCTFILEEQFKKNDHVACAWLSQFYSTNLTNSKVIHLIAHSLEATTIQRIDQLTRPIALAMLSYNDIQIKEYGVKIIEKSVTTENLETLKSIATETEWLNDYIGRVIHDFEKELNVCQF